MKLDKFDFKILNALANDGRVSWRDLAEQIGLSLTPTLRRVRLLEEEGYIQGYFARLDETRLSGELVVFVSVAMDKQAVEALTLFEERVAQVPEVMSCFLMTGDADYLLRVVVRDLHTYQSFLVNTLTRIPGVAHIKSSFALKTVLMRNAPPF
ncbi:Lrp/AsnC family transcriptional regulator [Noviherbaspirillum suwonense]|jgi:Lrp/AsnC family leucine-responsive transcriptional regulator|uniref:Transcriptional regulator, AsnC family n=1 Tax=Noviherbaspirillum suwonense TaxID=1224511 RepID=A0ABY1Q8B1_9BURK|nr:Lrp/AsnC family transcriptional regulator [Noviherbaspirillum suwonense]SMP60946.1 transcriptional regulator, AsnC family [Noviherbaspirillum suwonense]